MIFVRVAIGLTISVLLLLIAVKQPVTERELAAVDAWKTQRAREVAGDGLDMSIASRHQPLFLFRRPFDGLIAKAVLLVNLPATIVAFAAETTLRDSSVPARPSLDIVTAIFVFAVCVQWVAVAWLAKRLGTRR